MILTMLRKLIEQTADIHHSLVNNGCIISGHLDHSVLFENVHVGVGSLIKQSILLPGARIGAHVQLDRVIVQERVTIPDHTKIAISPDEEPLVVSNDNLQEVMNMKDKVGSIGNYDGLNQFRARA